MAAGLLQSDELRAAMDRWDAIERHLPGYPPALFELVQRELSLPAQPVVVDVGCGSGRATMVMARLGWRVTGVDPDEAALAVLSARARAEALEITAVTATAESTHLRSASADGVTAAHAFHWFDGPAALVEMARLTRPGGGVALFWNMRDLARSPFLVAFIELLDRYHVPKSMYLEPDRASRAAGRALRRAPGFEAPVLHELHHERAMRPEDFVGTTLRAAYARAFSPAVEARFRTELTELLGAHGYAAGNTFSVPSRIDCWTARRSPG